MLVEVFDATGTLGSAWRAAPARSVMVRRSRTSRLAGAAGGIPSAIVAGSLLGTSSTTVGESSGVQAGGRRGLLGMDCGGAVPRGTVLRAGVGGLGAGFRHAPALLFVATLMMRELAGVQWDDVTEAAPAALTAMMMPSTYSIANGLAAGFISYAVLKAATGRARGGAATSRVVAALFVLRFAFAARAICDTVPFPRVSRVFRTERGVAYRSDCCP